MSTTTEDRRIARADLSRWLSAALDEAAETWTGELDSGALAAQRTEHGLALTISDEAGHPLAQTLLTQILVGIGPED